ncbi:ATP-dependent DNA helicase [Actinopolymorpha sp. B17G11]|uniref:ATP-dependent helicase n=1 Tax=Actinopolymorpha sp. B17G11 TaxID=3160861 RepID=UPI0032E3DD7B
MTTQLGLPLQRESGVRYTAPELAGLLGLHPPTPEQAAVIEAPLEPGVIVAGAGSGKTETMATRVVWLVANGFVLPEQVLGLTFTRKAARELSARIRRRLSQLRARGHVELDGDVDGSPGDVTVSTYDAYAQRIVAEHALRLGREPGSRLVTPAMAWQYATRVAESYDGSMDAVDQAFSTIVNAVLTLHGEMSGHLVSAERIIEFTERLHASVAAKPSVARTRKALYADVADALARQRTRLQILPLVAAFEEEKRRREAVDFADQAALAAKLAEGFAEVGQQERARYGVVLLDEYQDTSHSQLVMLRGLFGGSTGHPITAVGDPCQSIYGWRGASAATLTAFGRHFRTSDGTLARTRDLTTSFRNGSAVLQVANVLAEPLRQGGLDVRELTAHPANRRGKVVAALHHTVDDEARDIAQRAKAIWDADARLRARGKPGRTVAVLIRKRSQIDRIAHVLRDAGLPVEIVGVGGLLTTPAVSDVVATLRVLADPGRGDALMRLLTGARWRIGPRDLAALGMWARMLAARTTEAARTSEAAGTSEAARGEAEPASTAGPRAEATAEPAADEVDDASIVDALDALDAMPARLLPKDESANEVAPNEVAPDEVAPDEVAPNEVAPNGEGADEERPDKDVPNGGRTSGGVRLSGEGYRRLRAVADELRSLRRRAGQPLVDLVADVVRTLGLDVEVAARTGDVAVSRADLDAFLDVAVAFAESGEGASLPAFLAYLDAADAEERGLEPGQAEVAEERIQVLTVHGAKGLEWDVVFVPGGVEGVFPAASAKDKAWLTDVGALPFALRGDADVLPVLDVEPAGDQREVKEAFDRFAQECGEWSRLEERRLAYVATTRARHLVMWSGYRWDETRRPREPGEYLREVAEACRSGAGTVPVWCADVDVAAGNPVTADPPRHAWPYDPLTPDRRGDIAVGAALVSAAAEQITVGRGSVAPAAETGEPATVSQTGPATDTSDAADEWARDVDLLLAERARRQARHELVVELPERLSVSQLVQLRQDPDALARAIRRPVPRAPNPLARRGTAFHAWLEARYGKPQLLDVDELPGSADGEAAPDEELAALQQAFLASEWAERQPIEVEVPFELVLAGVVVRGRADAVFSLQSETGLTGAVETGPAATSDAVGAPGIEVVDWKTGRPPTDPAEEAARAVQLAAYRLAWAQLTGLPLERVGAAFHYVRHCLTVRPVDLLDAAGLEALITSVPHEA